MTDRVHDEWEVLGRSWRGAWSDAPASDLRRRVRRQTRRMTAQLASEVALTAAAGWFLWFALSRDPGLETRMVCGGLALLTLCIWTVRVRTLRGVLWPTVHAVREYRALERERLARGLAEAKATAWICAGAFPFVAFLAAFHARADGVFALAALVPAVACAYLGGWFFWARRAARRRRRELVSWDSWAGPADDESREVADQTRA